MASNRLTKATTEALKPREREYFVWDVGAGSVQGFGIKVLPSGRQVAVFQYRLKGAGRRGWARRFTIGTLGPGLSFTSAKAMAEELRASKVIGGDPVHDTKAKAQAAVERNRLSKERTFKALSDAWLQKRSKLRSFIQLKRITKTHLGELNSRDVASLTYADLEVLVDKVEARAPFMARQVALALRSILDLGVRKGWVEENRAASIEIAAPHGGRDRVLTDPELVRIWQAAEAMGWPYGKAIQLLILTAARRSEVVGLDWSEIDVDAGLWKLPASRAKNNEAHVIHLSSQAVAVLKSLSKEKGNKLPKSGLIFSTTGNTPFSGFSKPKRRLDDAAKVEEWRLHDLRRTAATAMSEMGLSVQVVERVLNHRGMSRSGIVGIYQRSELLPERKAALEAWGKRVAALVSGRKPAGNVVPIKAARS
jgi:integrase